MKLYEQRKFYEKLIFEARLAIKPPKYVYRLMSFNELSHIMADNAFSRPISMEEDSDGVIHNITATDGREYSEFKSFTSKITSDLLRDFEEKIGGYAIVKFDTKALKNIPNSYFSEYIYDKTNYAINEHEYRVFFNGYKLPLPGDLKTYMPKAFIYDIPPEKQEEFMDDYGYDIEDYGIKIEFKR